MRVYKPLTPVFILFFIIALPCMIMPVQLQKAGIDPFVVGIGNVILLLLTVLSFQLHRIGLQSKGTPVFLGSVYGSFLMKLAVCATAAFSYAYIKRASLNLPALFVCMFLYLVYSAFETRALMHIHKRKDGKD